MVIAGRNGTGKSHLASYLAARWDRVLVFDPNVDDEAVLPNSAVCYSAPEALERLPGRVVWRPSTAESSEIPRLFDELVRKIMIGGGHHGIVVHELRHLGETDRELQTWTSALFRTRRRRAIPLILVTQRPANVPRLALSEAQHAVMFRLEDRDDRRRMGELMGPEVVGEPLPPDFSFWYRGPDSRLVRVAPLPY